MTTTEQQRLPVEAPPRAGRGPRLLRLIVVRADGPRVRPSTPHRRRAGRAAVLGFAAAFLAVSVLTLAALDRDARLRDPEYGRREGALKDRLAENPGRPLVLVIGSSRTAMGICPAAWEAARPGGPADPLLFNLSLVGSGPVMELLALKRALAAGVRPAVVLLEYWPAFLRQDGPFEEAARVDVTRLGWEDRDLIRSYFPDPAATERAMRAARANPVSGFRRRFVAQAVPSWLPWDKRMDGTWAGLDGWGWLPGVEDEPAMAAWARGARLAHCGPIYERQFAGYHVHPTADRALREAVAAVREHGAEPAFLFMPEATEFRGWYPAEVARAAREHLSGVCRDLAVPLIDTRDWMPDGATVDGFHLSRTGAAAFTPRLVPAVAAAVPKLRSRP